jgi:hypothetical protein
MDDVHDPLGQRAAVTTRPSAPPGGSGAASGVHGWLLVLCLMLTLIGPLISVWLMAHDYAVLAPHFPGAGGLQAAVFVSFAITTSSVAFGAYAGLGLWRLRPNAVSTAKFALLVGLAAEVITTVIAVVVEPTHPMEGRLLRQVTVELIPSLVFFTLCFAYLNRSSRVEATYGAPRGDA